MHDRDNPRHPLHGAFTKHLRASEQAIVLRALIESNSHDNRGYRLPREKTETEFIYRYEPIPLPLMWSVMLGEVIHNCRSALDHVITQLMLLRNPQERPNRNNEFPIHKTKESFDKHQGRQLYLLSPSDVTLVEQFQPYMAKLDGIDPLATPVFLLDQLWNIDKHRLVQILISDSLELRHISADPPCSTPGEWLRPLGPIRSGDIVYRRPVVPGPAFNVNCRVERPVCISDTGEATPGTTNVGEIMDTMVAFTDDVLTKADRLFPMYP